MSNSEYACCSCLNLELNYSLDKVHKIKEILSPEEIQGLTKK
jgi:hypothetical protein